MTYTHDMTTFDPEGPNYDLVPPGEYSMKLESVEATTSSNGKEMYCWVFVGAEGAVEGKKLFYYTLFSDVQRLGKAFLAVGIDPDGDVEFDPDEVQGADVIAEVYTGDIRGEKRSKIRHIMPTNGTTEHFPVRLNEDEVMKLDETGLQDLVKVQGLSIDLAKVKTLTKKRNAVLDALADADLLD